MPLPTPVGFLDRLALQAMELRQVQALSAELSARFDDILAGAAAAGHTLGELAAATSLPNGENVRARAIRSTTPTTVEPPSRLRGVTVSEAVTTSWQPSPDSMAGASC